MDLLLGLDVGTTATKAVLYDLHGRVVAASARSHRLITPRSGWVEQDPEELWHAAAGAIRELAGQVGPGDRVLAIAGSSQGGTTIPLADDGTPTFNAISWMDHRSVAQARAIREGIGAERLYQITGWPLIVGLPLQHIVWLRDNRPDVFAATARFCFVDDFIAYRLSGRFVTDPSDAGITQLMDIAVGDWDERLLAWGGIRREQLSPIWPSGTPIGGLSKPASETVGLPAGTLVINGAHDQYCAAVGVGVTRPGRILLSCGTAWVLLAVTPGREVGLNSGMAVSPHAIAGRWGAIRSLGGVGAWIEWLLNVTWGGANYEALNRAAASAPPGARGALFVTGENGRLVGLSLSHTRGDLARAVMEGIACELRRALESVNSKGIAVDELTMVGGATHSPVWPQIVADTSGRPVILPAARQAAARGAAIIAGVGAGVFANAEEGFAAWRGNEKRLEPTPSRREVYDSLFARYLEFTASQHLTGNWKA